MTVSGHPARSPPDGLPAVHGPLRAPPGAGWPDGAVRVTHPLRPLGVTPALRYYEVVRPSPVGAHLNLDKSGPSAEYRVADQPIFG